MPETITFTLPDGTKIEVEKGKTGIEIIQEKIGEGLARVAVAIKVNDVILDANLPLQDSGDFKVLTFKDKEGQEVFRHSSAHLMAQAVLELFPEAKLTIGPVVEEGFYYDFDHPPFTQEDLVKIEQKIKELIDQKLEIKRKVLDREDALEIFNNNPYKLELINEMPPGEIISSYQQGNFIDLCRGPHVSNTGMLKAVKITKLAGAYWRADANNKQLQRIYGISFPSKDELKEYVRIREEAAKRDHRVLGKKLDLFSFHELSPGSVFFHPKGTIIYNSLRDFMREEYNKRGYQEVITPNIFHKKLWETSGHWQHYKDNMFLTDVEGETFSLKPMNCPSHLLIYKQDVRSYRDLPLRIADFGALHRNELSGTLSGTTRVRKMCQDDAHIFVAPEQIEQEILDLLDFIKHVYSTFGFEYTVELSTKPEKAMGEPLLWEQAEAALENALTTKEIKFVLNPGDGAFYGPKIDFHIKDALGRSWQCATIQLDFQLPERFDATYEGNDGTKHRVVMIHRAIFGSLERFIGVLTEHYAARFPLWLSPVQIVLLPIADRHNEYCAEVMHQMKSSGLRVEIDDNALTTNKKIRNAQLQQINYILVVGDAEVTNKTVNVRTRDGEVHGEKKASELVDELVKEVKDRS
jgi:threonyl-tRNA synthetase